MLLLVWLVLTLSSATVPSHGVLPALAVGVRVFYVDRKWPPLPVGVVMGWFAVFGIMLAVGAVSDAVRLFVFLVVSSILLTHLVTRARYTGGRWHGLQANAFRAYRKKELLLKRAKDMKFVIDMRSRDARFRVLKKLGLWGPAAITALLDGARIARQDRILIESRGGVPASREWLSDHESESLVIVGDVLLLAALAISIGAEATVLLPPLLEQLLAYITSGGAAPAR